jgi:hypothetical protein
MSRAGASGRYIREFSYFFWRKQMNYKSLDQEWDETSKEMENVRPKYGDKVLCAALDVQAGEVVGFENGFLVIRLDDGSVDQFAREDVLVRKAA